jgi:hypothetical protein
LSLKKPIDRSSREACANLSRISLLFSARGAGCLWAGLSNSLIRPNCERWKSSSLFTHHFPGVTIISAKVSVKGG